MDYLLPEGTTVGRGSHTFPTEQELEEWFVEQFRHNSGINLVYASGCLDTGDSNISPKYSCIQCENVEEKGFTVKTISLAAQLPP